MKKNKFKHFRKLILVTTLSMAFLFLIALNVIGGVNYLGNKLQTNYSYGDKILGNVYLEIENAPGELAVTSNFGGNVTLIDLIRSHQNLIEGEDYTCTSVGCVNSYSSYGLINQVSLDYEPEFFGFGIDGPGVSVKNARITINSNAPASCTPNVFVDILADDDEVLTSNQGNGESCGIKHTGCYNMSNTAQTTLSTGREYCEKIRIPSSPAMILGGNIGKGEGVSNLTMKLYSLAGSLLGSCRLPQSSQSFQELSCIANYSSHQSQEYYVCVTTSVNNNYKVGWETSSPNCGTAQGFNFLNSDFDLFAETVKYAASPRFVINQENYKDAFRSNLTQKLNNYLQSNYNGNCESSSCFIPIKIFGTNQYATFNDYIINYESVGIPASNQNVYGLDYRSPKINAENLSIDISNANFVVPERSTDNKFKFYIGGVKLFEKDLAIQRGFAFDIYPKLVAFGQNSRFTILSDINITESVWDFGDGSQKQMTNGNFAFHAFTAPNVSSFDINVTAVNNQTKATRQFKIFVGSPVEIANQTIRDYKNRLNNLSSQINSYPSWFTKKIQEIINLSNMNGSLNSIEIKYKSAVSEQDYQNVMLELIALDVPLYLSSAQSGNSLPLSVGYENFNLNYIEQLENKVIENKELLRDQIVIWMNDNFMPEISFKKIEAKGDFESSTVGTLFTIETKPVKSVDSSPVYLIIGHDVENYGLYKQDYSVKSVTSGIDYFTLDSNSQTFEFFIQDDVDAESLGAYISPSLDILSNIELPDEECNLNDICEAYESSSSCPEDCSGGWFKFTFFAWIILTLMGLVIYILLQEWYKKNYQHSLFPENNDLYNLITFIYNTRKSGLRDKDIKAKLIQQGWSNERVNFAFNKVDGKRIGMFEIPLFTRRDHKETIKQIYERREKVDVRFIKRPFLN